LQRPTPQQDLLEHPSLLVQHRLLTLEVHLPLLLLPLPLLHPVVVPQELLLLLPLLLLPPNRL
jgi:hypothetical protein